MGAKMNLTLAASPLNPMVSFGDLAFFVGLFFLFILGSRRG